MIGTTIQARIDAQQTFEAIDYGLRSIKVCRGAYGASPCHVAQIAAACEAGAMVLGREQPIGLDNGTGFVLKRAKQEARVALAAAREAEKELGNRRQVRLALAA